MMSLDYRNENGKERGEDGKRGRMKRWTGDNRKLLVKDTEYFGDIEGSKNVHKNHKNQ